jgi:glucose/mannose-6-phosphate isomerase
MLDDLKLIHERDAEDALGIAEKQGEQLLRDLPLQGEASFTGLYNVVYVGMGGSALAASLVGTWPRVAIPFEVVRGYNLPDYVNDHTLVIVASYSGNTEEALSALAEAETKGAQIVVIAGGGKLKEAAEAKQYPWVELPKAAQPRYAVLYNFRALLEILAAAGLLDRESVMAELEKAAPFLSSTTAAWRPDVPTANNPAKQLAQELVGKSVVVYGGPKLYPAAYKWKISFNENAKHIAWAGQYPEFNHNEFLGWSKQPTDKPYAVIDLRSSFEHERVQKRFEVSARLLSGMRPDPHVVEAQGETVLEQLLWTIAYGDFVTLYLALLNGLNPAPVDLIEKFKQELNK